MDFSGRLAAFPPGDLLQWAANDRRSGTVVVRRRSREKRIFLQEGQVVACVSDDPAEFYGQHLLLGGFLEERQLVDALTHCQRSGVRLGQALEELALLPAETIEATLREYIEDSVCDLFLWPHGVFYLDEEQAPPDQVLPRPLDSMALALRGSRWADEHRGIREVLSHDEVVLRKVVGEGREAEAEEPLFRRILTEIDGRRTLERLYRATGGSYFRFLKACLDLHERGWVEIEEAVDQQHQPTMEISIRDLLDDQATTEEMSTEDRWILTLESLGRMVPMWVGELPTLDDTNGLRHRLYRRCDGQTRLAEVLGDADELRETFVQALHAGAIGLLPQPLTDLEGAAAREDIPDERRWWQKLFNADRAGRPVSAV